MKAKNTRGIARAINRLGFGVLIALLFTALSVTWKINAALRSERGRIGEIVDFSGPVSLEDAQELDAGEGNFLYSYAMNLEAGKYWVDEINETAAEYKPNEDEQAGGVVLVGINDLRGLTLKNRERDFKLLKQDGVDDGVAHLSGNEVLVSLYFADKNELQIGDTIKLRAEEAGKKEKMRVAGIFSVKGNDLNNVIFANIGENSLLNNEEIEILGGNLYFEDAKKGRELVDNWNSEGEVALNKQTYISLKERLLWKEIVGVIASMALFGIVAVNCRRLYGLGRSRIKVFICVAAVIACAAILGWYLARPIGNSVLKEDEPKDVIDAPSGDNREYYENKGLMYMEYKNEV